MDTEQQLIQQCVQGDKSAFGSLVQPHLQRAYSTAFAILGTRHLAEDAVQNALLETYTTIMREREIRVFQAWFTRLVTCRALDIARQKSKQWNALEESEFSEISDESGSPVDNVLQKERQSELLQAIMRLNIQQRAVIVLFYYEEMKIGEIADLLHIKEGTVKSRLHQARLTLSKLVPFESAKQKVGECR